RASAAARRGRCAQPPRPGGGAPVTAAAAAWAVPAAAGGGGGQFPAVLDGVALEGPAARLAGMLDGAFLAGAGWDPVTRVLFLPAGHRLLGRTLCRVGGCAATAHG